MATAEKKKMLLDLDLTHYFNNHVVAIVIL
jgi:hypothetical protein